MPSLKPNEVFRGLTYEQLEVGQLFEGDKRITVTEAEVISFARQWDPQTFHIDRETASQSLFGRIVASGLQTLSLSYWLYYDHGLLRGTAIAGLGMDEVRFLKPLYPDDTISVKMCVIEKSPSSKAGRGKIKLRIETYNQDHDLICTFILLPIVQSKAENDHEGHNPDKGAR